MPELISLLCLLTAPLILLLCLWTAYLVSVRIAGVTSVSQRWATTSLVTWWLLVAHFYLLSLASAFRLAPALALCAVMAAIAHRSWSRKLEAPTLLASDLRHFWRLIRQGLGSPLRWLLIPAAVLATLRMHRGLGAPPLAWDALTYHLVKAGSWVQSGGWVPLRGPDAWGYYEYFPPIGEIFWAWAMLPAMGDALLAPAGLLIWLTLLLGAYAAARSLQAGRTGALLAALAIGLTPAVFNFITAAYVNNTTLACLLLGVALLPQTLRDPQPRWVLLSGAGFGLAAGTQHSGIPFLVLFWGLLGLTLLWRPIPWRRRLAALGVSAVAAAVAAPGYLRALIEQGSPLYPLPVKVGGWILHPGHEEFVLLQNGELTETNITPLIELLQILSYKVQLPAQDHANLGPAGLALAALGLVSAIALLRRPGRRLVTIFLLLSMSMIILGFSSEEMVMQRTHWAYVSGRFLTPALAALVILIPSWGARPTQAVLAVAITFNLLFGIPRGWSMADFAAMGQLAPPMLLGLLPGAGLLLWLNQRGRPVAAICAAAMAVYLGVALRLQEVRARYRYQIYAAAARLPIAWSWDHSVDVHTLFPLSVASWPIWQHLDQGPPHRLAVTAGWDGVGHNWYLSPLMGSALQNKLHYVSPTRDGRILDHRHVEQLNAQADLRAWLQRLLDQRIDHVVALSPHPLEDRWMMAQYRLFLPVAVGQGGLGHLYRLHLPNIRSWLSQTYNATAQNDN